MDPVADLGGGEEGLDPPLKRKKKNENTLDLLEFYHQKKNTLGLLLFFFIYVPSALLTFPVVFLKKTTFLGVFENIIGCFSILQPKMR
jgi:hypothetical protein